MNFNIDLHYLPWTKFTGQADDQVTYIYVSTKKIARLEGSSDILYIGKTKKPIDKRINAEISSNNSQGNTQVTNIRITHIIKEKIREDYAIYFTKCLEKKLMGDDLEKFLKKLKVWDKNYFKSIKEGKCDIEISIEKILLVEYASEHLELPPLNNRF